MLLTEEQVRDAVAVCQEFDWFVIDVETRETEKAREADSPNPRTNEVVWVGLGVPGNVFLIPMGHPKGRLISPRHQESKPAYEFYDRLDPEWCIPSKRSLPPGEWVASTRQVKYWVEAEYEDPPDQLRPSQVFDILRPLLFGNAAKIGHNVKFDLQSIAKYYDHVLPPGPYHDTILLRHLLDENLDSYKLKELTFSWFGIRKYTVWYHTERCDRTNSECGGTCWPEDSFYYRRVLRPSREDWYPNLGKNPMDHGLDDIARYLAKDVRFCQLMFQWHEPKLDRFGVRDAYEFEMKLYPVIMQMEYNGFPIDESKREAVSLDLNTKIAEVEEAAWKLAGDQFSLSKANTKRWIMFGEGDSCWGVHRRKLRTENLEPLSRTKKTNTAQINQDALEFYAGRGNEMASLLLEWSTLDKLRGTFVDGMDKFLVDNPGSYRTLHTGFRQSGTVTGRLSSAKPNLQQIPRN